jgi:hypothetical protein
MGAWQTWTFALIVAVGSTGCLHAPVVVEPSDEQRLDDGMRFERYTAQTPGADGIALVAPAEPEIAVDEELPVNPFYGPGGPGFIGGRGYGGRQFARGSRGFGRRSLTFNSGSTLATGGRHF